MVAYQHFVALSHSSDPDQRAQAARMVADAYLNHDGPADENAALYASLLGFLDDSSVKVRAALAFGLLYSRDAPRVIMLALVRDAPVIARAVVQHSPVLLEVDLVRVARDAPMRVVEALACRDQISERLAKAILDRGGEGVVLGILKRGDVTVPGPVLARVAEQFGHVAAVRGALLDRDALPGLSRLALVRQITEDLSACSLVSGAIQPGRIERLMRDGVDGATSRIGEKEAAGGGDGFARALLGEERINARLLLHAVINGQGLFFAQCLAVVSGMPLEKIFTLLENGVRAALDALFRQCGMDGAQSSLLARLVLFARSCDLSSDWASRHYVVGALIEELIIEHDGDIPESLEEIFHYLDEQNLVLARAAARGVMPRFSQTVGDERVLPVADQELSNAALGRQLERQAQMRVPQVTGARGQLALPAA